MRETTTPHDTPPLTPPTPSPTINTKRRQGTDPSRVAPASSFSAPTRPPQTQRKQKSKEPVLSATPPPPFIRAPPPPPFILSATPPPPFILSATQWSRRTWHMRKRYQWQTLFIAGPATALAVPPTVIPAQAGTQKRYQWQTLFIAGPATALAVLADISATKNISAFQLQNICHCPPPSFPRPPSLPRTHVPPKGKTKTPFPPKPPRKGASPSLPLGGETPTTTPPAPASPPATPAHSTPPPATPPANY